MGTNNISHHHIIKKFVYRHPIFNEQTLKMQKDLFKINNHPPIYFSGSYFGNGFHEDAVQASDLVYERIMEETEGQSSEFFKKSI